MEYKELIDALRSWDEHYISVECGESLNCSHYCESEDCLVNQAADELERLGTEIERLKNSNDVLRSERDELHKNNCGLRAENARLRAELDAAVRFIRHIDSEYGRYINDTGFEKWRGAKGENDGKA